jgi:cell wall-associated NlpC family hydrolase
MLGDVLVFQRTGGGHVGLYVGEDEAAFHVLGGNQGDRVCIARIARHRLYSARRPAYRAMPATVRTYSLAPAGALSANEA